MTVIQGGNGTGHSMGKKTKASHGFKMNVDKETVKKFVDFCLRPDNIKDVADGSRFVEVDDGTSFIRPIGFARATELKWHMHSSKSSVTKCRKCPPEHGCTKLWQVKKQ